MYTVENLLRDYGDLIDNGEWQELFDGDFMWALGDIDAKQASKIFYTILFDLGGIAYINKFKSAYGSCLFNHQKFKEIDLSHFAENVSDTHTLMTLYIPDVKIDKLILPASDQTMTLTLRSELDVKQLIFKSTTGKAGVIKPLTTNTLRHCKDSLEYLEIPVWGLFKGDNSSIEFNSMARELFDDDNYFTKLKEICLTDTANYAELVYMIEHTSTIYDYYKITTK